MIGDDDFFMQNSDYHYGASDEEKMYGRDYYDPSDYARGYQPSSYSYESSYKGYESNYTGYQSSSNARTNSNSNSSISSHENKSSGNDSAGKYCLAGILIVLAILIMATVVVPAITESMSNSVTIDDVKITRYILSTKYESKVSTDKGYEITYNQKSYGKPVTNFIFYSKNGEVLYNESNYMGTHYLKDVPYIVYLDEKADYAIFEVYRKEYGKCIYRERVDVDNINVKKELIDYDSLYY